MTAYTVVNNTNLANLTTSGTAAGTSGYFALESKNSVIRLSHAGGATNYIISTAGTTASPVHPFMDAGTETFVRVPHKVAHISSIEDTGSAFTVSFTTDHHFVAGDYAQITGTTNYNSSAGAASQIASVVNATAITFATSSDRDAETTGTVKLAYKLSVKALASITGLSATEVMVIG